MELKISVRNIRIEIMGDLNYVAVKELKEVLKNQTKGQIEGLELDLTHAKLINSEGIHFLCQLLKHDYKVQLINPPDLFEEVVELLGLETLMRPLFQKSTTEKPSWLN